MLDLSLGKRIKARREELGFNLEAVSSLMEFEDRQTLSAIESCGRRVSPDELLRFMEVLDAPLEYFMDPFRLVGEGSFSWRQSGVPRPSLDDYERRAGCLIALYRTLGVRSGRLPPLLRHKLEISKFSSLEDAAAAGERFARDYGLGGISAPALRLAKVMEQDLGILVLMVDPVPGVSGAACRLDDLDAVIINRQEPLSRRNFDLAHELFHILTWDSMPPERVDDTCGRIRGRADLLADSFAAALLMPAETIESFCSWHELSGDVLVDQLNMAADELLVSSSALRWRLVNAGMLSRDVANATDERKLRNNGRKRARKDTPPLFSRPFLELVADSIEKGEISRRRAAGLLELSLDDLPEAFGAHGIDFALGI